MDPITQGLLGAAAAQLIVRSPRAAWIGALGMLPDLDVLIRSPVDPTVALKYHRHFTHSLAFIPVGGPLAGALWKGWARLRGHDDSWRDALVAATAGFATHALLDCFTSYGTLLLWPLSEARIAWHRVAIIDPLVTGALALGVWWAARRGTPGPARAALLWVALYIAGLGSLQHHRAASAQAAIAASRGHTPERAEVLPGIGSLLAWRSIYAVGDTIYADRLRVPLLGAPAWVPGGEARAVGLEDLPQVAGDPQLAGAYAIFEWFADGWTGAADVGGPFVGDLRYAPDLGGAAPMWGVRFHPEVAPGAEGRVERVNNRPRGGDAFGRLAESWLGGPGEQAIPR